MTWRVEYLKEALEDLKQLDRSQRLQVLKAIKKVSSNPLPQNEGGYGKPLRNINSVRLAGLLKIKLKNSGLRVVYTLAKGKRSMTILVVSNRADNEAYLLAQKRTK